jgi:hypothetical protein
MSWYASKGEVVATFPGLGNVVRNPWNMTETEPRLLIEDGEGGQSMCKLMNGINHPPVPKTNENSKTLWGDSLNGMMNKWHGNGDVDKDNAKCKNKVAFDNWGDRVCPGGWSEYNKDCPWSFKSNQDVATCLKSCYQWANVLEPMRDPEENETINAWDCALLSITFVVMTYMVATWTIFREKAKQRLVLVLCILMWLQTLIELLGYIIYPKSDDRYCENDAVPHHHGFNYCAVSAMLIQGIISPMFQLMIACMAIDVYQKIILNAKNKSHYWKYYTMGSFFIAFFGKFVPVFLLGEVGGFDGVNNCGYTFYLRQPNSILSPTPVEMINPKFDLDLYQIILMNTVEKFAWVVSIVLFTRIIFAVIKSLKRVNVTAGNDESAITTALKQLRVVKTPVLMIFFFTIVSAVQIYCWDVYAVQNWKYFGPDANPDSKTWNNVFLLWAYPRVVDVVGVPVLEPELAIQTWDNIDSLTKIMNYYVKLINHFAFPLLLFMVFGMNEENVKLWFQKLGVEYSWGSSSSSSSSSESSTSSSSGDWSIVSANRKIKKMGVARCALVFL